MDIPEKTSGTSNLHTRGHTESVRTLFYVLTATVGVFTVGVICGVLLQYLLGC